MELHTFDELDNFAWQMLEGETAPLKIVSLNPTERLTALELTFAMALCKLGVLSPSASGAFKLKIYNEHKRFAVEFNHLYKIYERWIDDNKEASTTISAYDKAMRVGDKDEALRLSAIIIGKLTGEDHVHYKIYEKYCTDTDCKAKVEQAGRKYGKTSDEYDNRLPYSTIVDSLFRFFKPERMVELWKPLGVDCPKPKSTRVPPKQDNTAWAVKMVKNSYGVKDNKKLSDVQEKQTLPERKQDVPVQSV